MPVSQVFFLALPLRISLPHETKKAEVMLSMLYTAYRDMQRRHVSWLLTNLPEDPDCSELLEVRPVQEGDFRKGLRPGVDVTVHAKDKIPQGTVLGLYRNITVTKAEENIIHDNPPERFEGTANEWRQKLDAYTTDIVQPGEGTRSRRLFKTYFEDSLKVWRCTTAFTSTSDSISANARQSLSSICTLRCAIKSLLGEFKPVLGDGHTCATYCIRPSILFCIRPSILMQYSLMLDLHCSSVAH